jgi:hypothetical protein
MIYGSREDLLWLAGLLEGEGSFDAHRGKYARIRLAMTDRDVVGRAATLMGAQFRLALHPAPAKATWHTEISGPRAAEIMAEILPHMGARRSQKIADVLGVVHYYALERAGDRITSSTPGPSVGRPAGILSIGELEEAA